MATVCLFSFLDGGYVARCRLPPWHASHQHHPSNQGLPVAFACQGWTVLPRQHNNMKCEMPASTPSRAARNSTARFGFSANNLATWCSSSLTLFLRMNQKRYAKGWGWGGGGWRLEQGKRLSSETLGKKNCQTTGKQEGELKKSKKILILNSQSSIKIH